MAIQPIDLQTLFVRLSSVGREQSAIKQAIVQNQEVTGREIAQRSQQASHVVQEAEEVSEGPEKVQEEEERPAHRQNQGGNDAPPSGEPASAHNRDEEFRDPDLGQNIDVTG